MDVRSLVKLPDGYELRRLEPEDYDRGIFTVLEGLTVVGDISREQFDDFVAKINRSPDTHYTLVIVNKNLNRVAAVGSVLIEYKLIHACGIVGHIEDVAVLKEEQGKGLGRQLVAAMDAIGQRSGAYKNILNCTDAMRSYYTSCGYSDTGHMMNTHI